MIIRHTILTITGFCTVLVMSACASYQDNVDHVTASRIARPAFMVERVIPEGPYPLYAWERMRDRKEKAVLYIEGADETNPVGLHLASRDRTRNVAYLAQPCQYSTGSGDNCEQGFYQPGSVEVLATYNAVMDEMRARYGLTGFDLVGHGSGGNIAALLAADRDDVLSLRTVAAPLAPAEGLSATAIAPELADMPQHHFIGAADDLVTPESYHFFRQAMGPSDCTHYTLVQDANHERGWVEEWPTFLTYPTECAINMEGYDPEPFPGLPYDKGKI
ncbi:MAG: hypothetical protein AAF569_06155 [Pseudomonadota bacterium]